MKVKFSFLCVLLCLLPIPTAWGAMRVFGGNSLMRLANPSPNGFAPPPSNMPPPGVMNPNWENYGQMAVVACGRDAMGVWRTVPLHISYRYNGFQYNVTVLSAWNPWTDAWMDDLNLPAVNTYFTNNGTEYDFYVVLSTGTFYFNL